MEANSVLLTLSAGQLRRAAKMRERIDTLKARYVETLTPKQEIIPAVGLQPRRRSKFSPAVRIRLADIARARWRKARRLGKSRL